MSNDFMNGGLVDMEIVLLDAKRFSGEVNGVKVHYIYKSDMSPCYRMSPPGTEAEHKSPWSEHSKSEKWKVRLSFNRTSTAFRTNPEWAP